MTIIELEDAYNKAVKTERYQMMIAVQEAYDDASNEVCTYEDALKSLLYITRIMHEKAE